MKFKSILGIVLVVALVGIAVFSIIKKDVAKEEPKTEVIEGGGENDGGGIAVGKKAPDFKLQNLDGEEVSLSDFKGKKVMINFWATWCPPCKAETPHMVKYYDEKAKEANMEILAVNAMSTESKSENVGKFIKEYKMKYPVVIDPRGEVLSQFEVLSFPTSFFVNTDGIIQYKTNMVTESQLEDIIKSLD